ncbi:MAG: xanthine dehydrogenase family protein molybdopterin-binding subunit [Cyanobacteria bacterium SZAS LIN-2]|nr:xanthine dehydrogenase family protein molybdopterin-binding subunit [Cyanobacteria bacterium SZAS LIN-2]
MAIKADKSPAFTTIGRPLDRTDGRLKVTGRAAYTGDIPAEGLLHAVLITSTIARGSVSKIDSSAAEALPGVIAVFSPANPPGIVPKSDKTGKESQLLLQTNKVFYHGQIIGLVVAESLEQAQHAASLVKVNYRRSQAVTKMDTRASALVTPEDAGGGRGSIKSGLAAASSTIKATYTTPTESHNPMEPFATTAVWQGQALTLYDSTQAITNTQKNIAAALGIGPAKVRVISHFVGGGFGCKLSTWAHVGITAMAARKLKRPVKLVMSRSQMFGPVGFRPKTIQTVTLAAKKDGSLTAMRHDTISETSRVVEFIEHCSSVSLNTYLCKNVSTSQRVAPIDIGKPTWMRAPGHAPGSFALECAMDELACALKIDPIALRLRNYADTDQESGLPWSSNALKECYKLGAEKFGWHMRSPKPGSVREDGLLTGMGMATAVHSVWRNPSQAMVRILADGTAVASAGTQEIGTGTYTVMSQIAAEILGLPIDKVDFKLGDSDLPHAPLSGGSTTAGSVGPAVAQAAREALRKLINTAVADPQSPLYGAAAEAVSCRDGALSANGKSESLAAIVARTPEKYIEAKVDHKPGDEEKHFAMSTFGAQFAEVAVDPDLGLIHVRKFVGAYGGGRILNAKTARSQMLGGIAFGIGMALTEQTIMDNNCHRIVNNNLGEYYLPSNADVPHLDVYFVQEDDAHVNDLGVKGIGELGITGVAAAIANAVYNATGKRVRDLPITLDKLI